MSDGYNNEPMSDYDEDLDWDAIGNPPPAHKFNIHVEAATYKPSGKGKHMVKVEFKIDGYDPEHPEDENCIGRTIFTNFNFTTQGAFLVKMFCDATGVEKPSRVNKSILEDWAAGILNVQTCVQLKHRLWNEQLQADISKFLTLMEVGNDVSVDDQSGQESSEETSEAEESEELDANAEETEEVEEPAPPPRRSLREAAAAAKPAVKPAAKANGTNGHVNGHTNGAAKKPVPVAAKKTAAKQATARR